MNEGRNSMISGLKGIPRASEDIMIARDIELAESLNLPVHICHVSTYSGVELIREAKRRGVAVTCETCPHYIALTDDIIVGYDTDTKVNPPIREERDRQAIIEGLRDGTIDCIVTDHAPHSKKDKDVEYDLAPFGISGIETSFAVCYTNLVKTGALTLPDLMKKMSLNPAKILGLEGGELKAGEVADIAIADLDAKYKIDPEKFRSKGHNTPFKGYEVCGKIVETVVDGKTVFKEE